LSVDRIDRDAYRIQIGEATFEVQTELLVGDALDQVIYRDTIAVASPADLVLTDELRERVIEALAGHLERQGKKVAVE
jgi:hypothetical protein